MSRRIHYPRTCSECAGIYSTPSSFCDHKRVGHQNTNPCQRKQAQQIKSLNTNGSGNGNTSCNENNGSITTTSTTNNHCNITNNYGLPEWLDATELKGCVEDIKKAVALLESIGIKGLIDTDLYLRSKQLTHDDYLAAIRAKTAELDKIMQSVGERAARTSPRSYIEALQMFYNAIFKYDTSIEVTPEAYSRRCVNLDKSTDSICDMVKYSKNGRLNDDCVLELRKAHLLSTTGGHPLELITAVWWVLN